MLKEGANGNKEWKKLPVFSLQNLLNSAPVLVTLGYSQLPCLCCSSHWAVLMEPSWGCPNSHQTKKTGKLVTAHHPRATSQCFHCSYNEQRCPRGWCLTPFYAGALRFMNCLSQTIPSPGSCCQTHARTLILKDPSELQELQCMSLSFDCSLGGDTSNTWFLHIPFHLVTGFRKELSPGIPGEELLHGFHYTPKCLWSLCTYWVCVFRQSFSKGFALEETEISYTEPFWRFWGNVWLKKFCFLSRLEYQITPVLRLTKTYVHIFISILMVPLKPVGLFTIFMAWQLHLFLHKWRLDFSSQSICVPY